MGNFSKLRAPYIFALAAAFFVFLLFMLIKSFPAEYNLYLRFLERVQTSDPFWTSLWFSSELTGEVGLVLRFAGACFFLACAWLLIKRRRLALSYLRKGLILEGAYYLFILPFIVSLFARPNTTTVNIEAGFSYTMQIVLITPVFFYLAHILRKSKLDGALALKWGAIAIIGFVLAMWMKHLLLNIYALPIDYSNPALLFGFVNSALTLLFAGLILVFAFLPIINCRKQSFNPRIVGTAFLLVGFYFIGYLLVALVNQSYFNYLFLTELWCVAFVILGAGYMLKAKQTIFDNFTD
jgi:hypothetical protein